MPLGILGGIAGAVAGAAGVGGLTLASGAMLGLAGGAAMATATGGLRGAGGGPSAGQVSGSELQMQQTIFGEQQGYEAQLQALLTNPSSVTSLPGYSFNLGQGSQAVARGMGAGGFGGSGNEAAALTKYGQDYAMGTYDQQIGILSQLSGITAPTSAGQAGGNAIGAQYNQNQQMQGIMQQLGLGAGLYSKGFFNAPGTPGSADAYGNMPGSAGYLTVPNAGPQIGGWTAAPMAPMSGDPGGASFMGLPAPSGGGM